MRFIEVYEPMLRMDDDSVISLGLFASYELANDAAVLKASEQLPNETVKAYEIHKVYINEALKWYYTTP